MINVDELAKKLWDYHHMNQNLKKSDCLLVLGSSDTRVAEYSSKLFLQKWATLIIFSGSSGEFTRHWEKSEAETFALVAKGLGVPEDKIIIEDRSTNTGENIDFVRKLIPEYKLSIKSFIIVTLPYMERRVYATVKKIWSNMDFVVTSPPIPFNKYPTATSPYDLTVNRMVGYLQRIKEYPKKGFAIEQDIPADVWEAYEKLVAIGYNTHLIR